MATYGEMIQERLRDGYCPFCHESSEAYIDHNDSAYVVPAPAPYNQDHVLICPISHKTSMLDLRSDELADIRSLITKRNHILVDKHQDVVIFVREGSAL